MPNRFSPGPCRCPVPVIVWGCQMNTSGPTTYYPIAGATVSYVMAGKSYGPWTTDSTGHATMSVCLSGSAVFTVTPPAGSNYATLTQTVTLATSGTQVFHLAPAAGYQCQGPTCCDDGTTAPGPPYEISAISWPSTIYLDDGHGTVSLTGAGGVPTSGNSWVGCAMRPSSECYVWDPGTCSYADNGPGTIPVYFRVACTNAVTSTFSVTVGFSRAGTSDHPYCSSGICHGSTTGPQIPYSDPACGDPDPCGNQAAINGPGLPPTAVSFQATSGPCPPAPINFSGTITGLTPGPGSGFSPNYTFPAYSVYGTTISITVSS